MIIAKMDVAKHDCTVTSVSYLHFCGDCKERTLYIFSCEHAIDKPSCAQISIAAFGGSLALSPHKDDPDCEPGKEET